MSFLDNFSSPQPLSLSLSLSPHIPKRLSSTWTEPQVANALRELKSRTKVQPSHYENFGTQTATLADDWQLVSDFKAFSHAFEKFHVVPSLRSVMVALSKLAFLAIVTCERLLSH